MYWAAFQGTRHPEVVVNVIDFLTTNVAAGLLLGVERGLNASKQVRSFVVADVTDRSEKRMAALGAELDELACLLPTPPPEGTRQGPHPADRRGREHPRQALRRPHRDIPLHGSGQRRPGQLTLSPPPAPEGRPGGGESGRGCGVSAGGGCGGCA